MSNSARLTTLSLAAFAFAAPLPGQDQVAGHLLVFQDNGAWSWFEEDRAIVDPLRGRVLTGSCASSSGLGGAARSGDIDVAWLDLSKGRFGSFELRNNLQSDDHNSPGLLVRPDGRYLAMYGTHGSSSLSRWRISDPGDPSQWTSEATFQHAASMSYSNLFHVAATGRTYNFVRAVNFDPNVMVSLDHGATWTGGGKLLTEGGGSDRPYLKYAGDHRPRMHLLTTERHPRNYDNSIYHGYVENDALHNSYGMVVDANVLDGAGQPPASLTTVFATGTVVGGVAMRRAWTIDVTVDEGAVVRGLFQCRANGSTSDHRLFFARFDGVAWNVHEVCRLGGFLYASEDDYTGLAALHPDRTDTIYVSTKVDPGTGAALLHYEIFAGVTPDLGASWVWSAVTQNSSVDNLRPIVPHWDAQRTALLWLRGSYATYTSYDLAVVGRIEAPELTFAPATYHDATLANTTLASGLPANPTSGAGTGANDNQWHLRTGFGNGFGNGGDVWTASETGSENAPMLRTRIAGLPQEAHDVLVQFWSNPNDDWSLRAGFANSTLRNFEKRGAAAADPAHFVGPMVTTGATVVLYSLWLGRATPDVLGNLDVYVDDFDAGQGSSSRSWYDGIATVPVSCQATSSRAGVGCNGNAEVVLLGTPQLGGAVSFGIGSAVPGTWALMVFGDGDLTPIGLAPIGYANCTLYTNPWTILSLGPIGASGLSPTLLLPIPAIPSLRCQRVGMQGAGWGIGLELTPAVVLMPGS
ncbi:MAG: BNR-4 repeat-containing protein [Planctomycetota bacterium]